MTIQERWDVALKVLNGPMAALGEQVLRGPVVRLGADPGPGGLKLGGYRGIDARQCVITAYTGGSAAVAPVGTHQVRLAPHANVAWADIDPLNGPQYLTPGCALHLGPIGRGATIEFVECRRLGEWRQGVLASERADAPAEGGVPAAYDVRRVGRIASSTAPVWFFGCSALMAVSAAGTMLSLGLAWYLNVKPQAIGPQEPGYEFYDSVSLDQGTLNLALLEGLEQPYFKFVMEPNIQIAGAAARGWDEPANWDTRFLQFVTASVQQHARSWAFFRRLDAVKNEYSKVVVALRQAGLPEVFAAIPYQESRYNASITSDVCAEGYWQFMPEVAHRLETREGMTFRVSDCKLRNTKVTWSPTEDAPPRNVRANAPYIEGDRCKIDRCDHDDRQNLERSTAAAVFTLKEAWTDPDFARSGSAVQLTISSHNAGYDDARFGAKFAKPFNIRPAFKAFVAKKGPAEGIRFTGDNIRCATAKERSACNAVYLAETQHYAYTIVAQHFLAVCYYAKNYGGDPGFAPWAFFVGSDGYCRQFDVPTRDDVARHRNTVGR
ncbi:MAG: transglycosylase SLT domain-containing protein [Myxococcota bacterium]